MEDKILIWKTVVIKDKPDLKGVNVSSSAQYLLDKITFPVKKQTINLVKILVRQLFKDDDIHTTTEIYAKAKELGLEFCPPQVGSQLRQEYQDQSSDEYLYIGMKPITDRYGNPSVFYLERGVDGLWLRDGWAYSDDRWNPDGQFVFSLRKALKSLKPLKIKHSDTFDTLEPWELKWLSWIEKTPWVRQLPQKQLNELKKLIKMIVKELE